MKTLIIDLHCHPGQRPYGKSFSKNPGENSTNKRHKNSIWYYDPPGIGDRLLNRVTSLTKFSQADITTLCYGNVRCVCASLYPIERGFVNMNLVKDGPLADFFAALVAGLGQERVNFLQQNKDYFTDLTKEYEYYKSLDGREITFEDGKRKYMLIKNFSDLESSMLQHEETGVEVVYVILSIEGLHVLNTGTGTAPDRATVLANMRTIKNWTHRPFFITFAHHFNNDLCGHAESMPDALQDFLTLQEPGMDTGFTALGWDVLKEMMDNSNGKRIHVDIKHMSVKSRTEYINYLKTSLSTAYQQKEIPLIISHGACNGRRSPLDPSPTSGLERTASNMYDADINFYDDEIVELARSGGIIGLQMDERRIASKRYKKSLRLELASATKRMHSNSKMVWNNIQHIAQLLDQNNLFAWENVAIGSDFDGIVDPINMFWTAEYMDDMVQYIERHAHNFMNNPENPLKNSFNKITAQEVIDRVFYSNAYEFFRKYYW